MTTLIAQRARHRIGRGALAHPPAPAVASGTDLIMWHNEADGVWTGRIDLLDAGVIRRTVDGYAVTAWDGSPEGVFLTLTAAQLSLEPAYRALLREQAEHRSHAALGTVLTVAGLAALTAAAATGLLTAFPL
jgi:hypothetical protein